MSILRKEYELSVWEDVQEQYDDGQTKRYRIQEKRIAIIGSHQMKSQNKAISPKLTRNINGSINFSFSMFTKYNDNITGEEKINPYVELLKNETKLKLYYDSNWYDLIIKKIDEDSANSKNNYSAISQHINELSRNGFNVELTDDLGNNTEDIFTLADTILKETDWTVDRGNSDFQIETREESLIPLQVTQPIQVIQIIEPSSEQTGTSWGVDLNFHTGKIEIQTDSIIYAFYSSCSGKPSLFQFYCFGSSQPHSGNSNITDLTSFTHSQTMELLTLDENRIIKNKGNQFCAIVTNEGPLNQYTVEQQDYNFYIPDWCRFNPVQEDLENNNLSYILTKMKGERYVFAEQSQYNSKLKAVLYKHRVTKDSPVDNLSRNQQVWMKKETNFFEPSICVNLAGNTEFTSVAGWQAGAVCDLGAIEHQDFASYRYKKNCKPGQETIDFLNEWTGEEDLIPFLNYQTNIKAQPILQGDESYRALQSLVCNGPNAQKAQIKSLTQGEKYEVLVKLKTVNKVTNLSNASVDELLSATIELAHHPYDANKGVYLFVPDQTDGRTNYSKVFSEATPSGIHGVGVRFSKLNNGDIDGIEDVSGYYRATLTIAQTMSEEELKHYTIQLFLYPDGYDNNRFNTWKNLEGNDVIRSLEFEEFYFYKQTTATIKNSETGEQETINLTPFTDLSVYENSISQTTYKYYSEEQIDDLQNGVDSPEDLKPIKTGDGAPAQKDGENLFEPLYFEDGRKIRRVQLNDSNYFNCISTLSETFSQWPVFSITRDPDGKIVDKKLLFKNYIGVETASGFRPGINLQSIKRNVNSQNITTKMIVKPNNNKIAKNGYCSIDEATANETGENTLYDFSYYINKGLINKDKLQYILYNQGKYENITTDDGPRIYFTEMKGEDVIEFYPNAYAYDDKENQTWSCQNFYNRLKILNSKIIKASNDGAQQRLVLLETKSKLDFQQRAIAAAEESAEEVRIKFEEVAAQGLPNMSEPLDDDMKELLGQSDTLTGYIQEYVEYLQIINKNSKDLEALQEQVSRLETAITTHSNNITRWTGYKQKLMQSFFKLYGRFIQEGTWIDEKYSDPELYYTDALSTLYTSARPQIQYTISVTDISSLPGYEHNRVNLGDKSYVEDEEFFGYDEQGFPYKEEVVLTEITNELDDSSKDSIKVQNYKTQFEDLFQRITASVQQTKLLEGAYKRAVNRTKEDSDEAIQFLETALGDENLELKKRGAQSISWTTDGLIITDDTSPSQRLRLIGGQILYSLVKSDGSLIWKTLLSTDGMSAAKLTAGTLNTDNIEIMSKGVPTLRLNKLGLTAYDWKNSLDDKIEVDLSRGIRFDKTGIYGYDTGDGTGDDRVSGPEFLPWKEGEGKTVPKNLDEAANYISQHDNVAFYLGWDGLHIKGQDSTKLRIGKNSNGILDIANSTGESIFNVSNDGIIKLCGSSGWTINTGSITTGNLGESGSFHMYSTGISDSAFGIFTDWLVRIGAHFGVTKTGDLYCSSGSFKGKIEATAGGTIAGWTIGSNNLRYNLNSFEDAAWDESGFYLSDRGIRFTHYKDSTSPTTEWFVDGKNGAMYLGVQGVFNNVWGNKNTVSTLNINMSVDKDGLIYYITDSINKFYFGTWLAPQWIKIGVDAATIPGMQSPGSAVISQQEELTIYARGATSFDPSYGGIYSKGYGTNYSSPGWIMYWNVDKKVYFPNKVYLGNDTESLDERLSDMDGSLSDVDKRLSALGFKGPYDLRFGSAQGTRIGRLYRQGNLVYGAIHKDVTETAVADKLFFICLEDSSTQVSIPGPIEGQTINWIHGNNSQYYIGVNLRKNSNGYLEMKTTSSVHNASGVYGNWSYFCYEIKESTRQPNAAF